MNRVKFSDLKNEVLKNPEVKAVYDELKPDYDLKKKLIFMRKNAGLTQQEMANYLNTQKSNISRLESFNSKNSPRLSTIESYAKVLGYQLKIDFEPIK